MLFKDLYAHHLIINSPRCCLSAYAFAEKLFEGANERSVSGWLIYFANGPLLRYRENSMACTRIVHESCDYLMYFDINLEQAVECFRSAEGPSSQTILATLYADMYRRFIDIESQIICWEIEKVD